VPGVGKNGNASSTAAKTRGDSRGEITDNLGWKIGMFALAGLALIGAAWSLYRQRSQVALICIALCGAFGVASFLGPLGCLILFAVTAAVVGVLWYVSAHLHIGAAVSLGKVQSALDAAVSGIGLAPDQHGDVVEQHIAGQANASDRAAIHATAMDQGVTVVIPENPKQPETKP